MANRAMTLNDLRNRENGGGGGRQPPNNMRLRNPDAAPAGGQGGGSGGLFGGMDGVQEKHPRREHWCDMWTTTFCPNFTIWSFTFLNVIIQLIVFIASLIFTSQTNQGLNDEWFLGNSLETLEKMGMRMPYEIKEDLQLWRLVLSLYINQGFTQIIINCLAQLFSGFMLEAQLGSLRMLFFFFSVGISANLFAATVDDKFAVGAEPAVFGMFTALAGMYIYYWDRMGQEFCRRVCGFFIIIILIVIAIFALSSFAEEYKLYSKIHYISYPDSMGYLGGAIFGFPAIWVFLPPVSGTHKNSTRREKGLLIGGLAWSITIFVIILCVFAFDYTPKEYSEFWPAYDDPKWDD